MIAGRLENGFRYLLYKNDLPAGRVSMHLDVRAGSLQEYENERGVAHFIEHMQFNGSRRFPSGELVKYFQRIGMRFGADANARTGFEETVFDILLPEGSESRLNEGLSVFADFATGAGLTPEEIGHERGVILAERRSRDTVDFRELRAALKFEMAGSLVANRLPIGKAEVVRNVTRPVMKSFYDAWYRPERMTLVAVGDFDPGNLIRLIRKQFGPLRPRAPMPSSPAFGTINHNGIQTFYLHDPDAGKTRVRIEVVTAAPPEPDTLADRRRRLLEDLANRIVRERLIALMRAPGAPFTEAGVDSGRFVRQIRFGKITATCRPGQWAASLAALDRILRQALSFGFQPQELERARRAMAAELDRAVAGMATRDSSALAEGILHSINTDRVFLSPVQERALLRPILTAATIDQVLAAFRQVWAPNHRLVLVMGNVVLTGGNRPATERIRNVYLAASRTVVAPRPPESPAVFPYLPAPRGSGAVATRTESRHPTHTRVIFQNGVHLNVMHTDFSDDEVLVRLELPGGRASEPPDQPALSQFAADLINESGLGRMDDEALTRALAGHPMRLNFAVDEDRFIFRGRVLSGDLEKMIQLLYAHLVDPGMRPDAATRCRERYTQAARSMAGTVKGALGLFGFRFLAGGDRRFGVPLPADYAARTVDEVRQWLLPVFERSSLEVTLVGDVDPETAVALVGRYFGTRSPRVSPETTGPGRGPVFPIGREMDLPIRSSAKNALVVVAFPTIDRWHIETMRRLSILTQILSDRLRVEIREALGAAYAPIAIHRPSRAYPGYGVLLVMSESAPDQMDRVQTAIWRVVSDVVANGVTRDELRRAVDPDLVAIRDLQHLNGYWADSVLSGSSRHPEQIAWSQNIRADYAAIDTAAVNRLARRILQKPNAAVIRIFPGPPDRSLKSDSAIPAPGE